MEWDTMGTLKSRAALTLGAHAGFSLIETMIAVSILAIGMLGLAGLMSEGMLHITNGQPDFIAKQKAAEAVESVFAARDTRLISWAQIRNASNGGIFLNGPQPIKDPGPDGLVNTADDAAAENINAPGPDNLLGTADDVTMPLTAFTREIQIMDTELNLRRITVTVRYRVGRLDKQYVLVTLIGSFA
jgi:prepilin-type N-terminal cleavage/methylation domain-containing protein